MALVAFYRQLLGILCPSVFVLSLSFYWLFYICLNISLYSALFLSLPISNILPEPCPSVLEINVILCSFLCLAGCLIVAIITVDLWYFLVAAICIQQEK